MPTKCSIHIISSDELNIRTYTEDYETDAFTDIRHKTFIIKYIFNNGLCKIFEKYSQKDYKNMYDDEIMIPLIKNNFIVITGVENILFTNLPSSLSQRQYDELKELFEKRKEENEKVVLIGFNEKEERGEVVNLGQQFTPQEALKYLSINYLTNSSNHSRKKS